MNDTRRIDAGEAGGQRYVIVSVKWTTKPDPCVTFWRSNDAGYCWRFEEAGIYDESRVLGNLSYYNNGDGALAVPYEKAAAFVTELSDNGRPFQGVPRSKLRSLKNRALKAEAPPAAQVIDLMAALKQSLAKADK